MIDLWIDGQIDCKDYAIYNSYRAKEVGASNIHWALTKDKRHVYITFEKDGYLYIADNDKLYRTSTRNNQR